MKKDFMNLMKTKTADIRPSLLSSEEAIKSQITVLEPLRSLIPPLTDDERGQLEQNLLKHGVKDPLTIWETTPAAAELGTGDQPAYVLIDGHNRYQIIQRHKLDFRINLVQFATLAEVRDYMIDYQLGRRNLSPEQTSYLRGLRYLQQKSMRGGNRLANDPPGNVAQALATEYGVSSRTIKRDAEFAAGLEKLTPALKQEVLAGKTRLPKSVINELATAPVTEPIGSLDQLGDPGATTRQPPDSAPDSPLETLRAEIRRLAAGRLDRKSCELLARKVTELLALQPAK